MHRQPYIDFLTNQRGDLIERGLIIFATVVSTIGLWYALGAQIVSRLFSVVGTP